MNRIRNHFGANITIKSLNKMYIKLINITEKLQIPLQASLMQNKKDAACRRVI